MYIYIYIYILQSLLTWHIQLEDALCTRGVLGSSWLWPPHPVGPSGGGLASCGREQTSWGRVVWMAGPWVFPKDNQASRSSSFRRDSSRNVSCIRETWWSGAGGWSTWGCECWTKVEGPTPWSRKRERWEETQAERNGLWEGKARQEEGEPCRGREATCGLGEKSRPSSTMARALLLVFTACYSSCCFGGWRAKWTCLITNDEGIYRAVHRPHCPGHSWLKPYVRGCGLTLRMKQNTRGSSAPPTHCGWPWAEGHPGLWAWLSETTFYSAVKRATKGLATAVNDMLKLKGMRPGHEAQHLASQFRCWDKFPPVGVT